MTELNARARAARLVGTPATADTGQPEVGVRDGTAASVGDVVPARHNRRDLSIAATEWVKSGDWFTVTVQWAPWGSNPQPADKSLGAHLSDGDVAGRLRWSNAS